MPAKRPANLTKLDESPAAGSNDSIKITDTMTLVVKDQDGKIMRVKAEGRQDTDGNKAPSSATSSNQSPQAPASKPKVEAIMDKIHFEDLKVLEVLGAGSQGKVRKAQHRITQELFALKGIAFSDDKDATRDVLRAELKRIAAIRHPNIVSSFEAYFREGKLYVVLELMDCGTLTGLMKKNGGGLPDKAVAYIALGFLRGLSHLKTSSVIHRDIKPGNLLLSSRGDVKIADFGVAKEFSKQQSAETLAPVGSTPYMSPERVKGVPYSYSCDIWSAGLSVAECAIGEYPFHNLKGNTFALCQAIASGTAKVGWELAAGRTFSPDLISFVNECLKPVETRPQADDLLSHPFVKQAESFAPSAMGAWFADPTKNLDELLANPPPPPTSPVVTGESSDLMKVSSSASQ